MTRLEYLQQVVAHLARATSPALQPTCLRLLECQRRTAHLEDVLMSSHDMLAMMAALAQYELMATGTTYLHQDPIPKNPKDGAVHFLSAATRIGRVTRCTVWMLMMWASLAPFKYAHSTRGSA